MSDLSKLWKTHWQVISDDILFTKSRALGKPGFILKETEIQYYALASMFYSDKYHKKYTSLSVLFLYFNHFILLMMHYIIAEIDYLLKSIGKCLKNYPHIPQPPKIYLDANKNNLVMEETNYNKEEMEKEYIELLLNCNEKRRSA